MSEDSLMERFCIVIQYQGDNLEDSDQREKEEGSTVLLAGKAEKWIPEMEIISLNSTTYMFISEFPSQLITKIKGTVPQNSFFYIVTPYCAAPG